ncbi:MAG: hypothetical protein SNJ78_04725 [Spirochaetales bacterium]
MREMLEHTPGKIYLSVLLLSIIGMIGVIMSGLMGQSVLVFGFITLPLLVGIIFVLVWLVAYLIYYFKFWPYR